MTLTGMLADGKEQLRHALRGEIVVEETESGPIYSKASEKEAVAAALELYDRAVYHCLQMTATANALERMLSDAAQNDPAAHLQTFMGLMAEEQDKLSGYCYENEADARREMFSVIEGGKMVPGEE